MALVALHTRISKRHLTPSNANPFHPGAPRRRQPAGQGGRAQGTQRGNQAGDGGAPPARRMVLTARKLSLHGIVWSLSDTNGHDGKLRRRALTVAPAGAAAAARGAAAAASGAAVAAGGPHARLQQPRGERWCITAIPDAQTNNAWSGLKRNTVHVRHHASGQHVPAGSSLARFGWSPLTRARHLNGAAPGRGDPEVAAAADAVRPVQGEEERVRGERNSCLHACSRSHTTTRVEPHLLGCRCVLVCPVWKGLSPTA